MRPDNRGHRPPTTIQQPMKSPNNNMNVGKYVSEKIAQAMADNQSSDPSTGQWSAGKPRYSSEARDRELAQERAGSYKPQAHMLNSAAALTQQSHQQLHLQPHQQTHPQHHGHPNTHQSGGRHHDLDPRQRSPRGSTEEVHGAVSPRSGHHHRDYREKYTPYTIDTQGRQKYIAQPPGMPTQHQSKAEEEHLLFLQQQQASPHSLATAAGYHQHRQHHMGQQPVSQSMISAAHFSNSKSTVKSGSTVGVPTQAVNVGLQPAMMPVYASTAPTMPHAPNTTAQPPPTAHLTPSHVPRENEPSPLIVSKYDCLSDDDA